MGSLGGSSAAVRIAGALTLRRFSAASSSSIYERGSFFQRRASALPSALSHPAVRGPGEAGGHAYAEDVSFSDVASLIR